MKILVTGAAGFIGSSLVDRLLKEKHSVIGIDNFSTGRREFLEEALKNDAFKLHEGDLFDFEFTKKTFSNEKPDFVFHLAANADVRDGLKFPRRDLEQNTIVTWNVLEASRLSGCKKFAFTSTGSIYGEAQVIPTPENCPFPEQTSLYGASKLAAEGLIAAYSEGYGIQSTVYRFVSLLGERYTHGHVFDFVKSLKKNPASIQVLGNGKQRKSYVYIGDCIDALVSGIRTEPKKKFEVYNLGTDEYVEVNDSLDVICEELKLKPTRTYTGGGEGLGGR